MKKDKKQNQNEINRSLAMLVHEIRGPLMGIGINIHLLKLILQREGKNNNRTDKIFLNLEQEMGLLKNVTGNIEVANLLPDNPSLQKFTETDFKLIFKKISSAFNRSKIEIINFEQLPVINVDKEGVFQLFYNLIYNALKYSYDDKSIKIKYIEPQNNELYKFEVIDEGIGFEEQDLDNIFEFGFRGENAMKKYPTGSGIGLAICKKIIESHKGSIEITNSISPTIITVKLPDNYEK